MYIEKHLYLHLAITSFVTRKLKKKIEKIILNFNYS